MNNRHFADRGQAGAVLAAEVTAWLRRNSPPGRPLVLGLPRGGVPVAAAVAAAIDAELDVLVVRKIGMPGQPEFGIGALTASGAPLFDTNTLTLLGLTEAGLQDVVARESAEAQRRAQRYRGDKPPPVITDRLVVVVDDGLATGVTARAALRWVRQQHPAYVVFAAPVCAADSARALHSEADAVLCVSAPEDFGAVGRWYSSFEQISDEEVEKLLARS